VKNEEFQTAAQLQAMMEGPRDRIVRTGPGADYNERQIDALNGFYRSAELEKWKKGESGDDKELDREINAYFDLQMNEWRRGGKDGLPILQALHDNENSLSASTYAAYVRELISGDDKHFTEAMAAFDSMEAALRTGAPKGANATPEAVAAYEQYTKDVMDIIVAERLRGRTDLSGFVEQQARILESELLKRVVLEGHIGTRGVFGGEAEKILEEWTISANRGDTDHLIGTRYTARASELVYAGKLGEAINYINEEGKTVVQKLLSDLDYDTRIEGVGQMETKENGDMTGAFHYRGNDGKTYRLNVQTNFWGKSFYVEARDGNEWKRVEKRERDSTETTVPALPPSAGRTTPYDRSLNPYMPPSSTPTPQTPAAPQQLPNVPDFSSFGRNSAYDRSLNPYTPRR
jgi:hypothetical protein